LLNIYAEASHTDFGVYDLKIKTIPKAILGRDYEIYCYVI